MPDTSIRLQLMIGPVMPIPAPYEVIDALISLEVTNNDRERDGFQMTFALGKSTVLDYELFQNGFFEPPSHVIIMVIAAGVPQVLLDGIITTHQVVPSNNPGQSTLVVTGDDVSLQLDLVQKKASYPNQSDSTIVNQLTSRYGLVPRVTDTSDTPQKNSYKRTQNETDLAFIRRIGQENGFIFYIEPTNVVGTNIAYWGIDTRLGEPQPALTMNMGADTNIDTPLTFSFNALGPATPRVTIVEKKTKLAIPIPIPSLLEVPLSSQPALPLRTTLGTDTAKLSLAKAVLKALTTVDESADVVTATGEVDTVRYGHILRARRLVGVRGAGYNYDGVYYVKQVTHRIKRGEYKQGFSLAREGRGSLLPRVIP